MRSAWSHLLCLARVLPPPSPACTANATACRTRSRASGAPVLMPCAETPNAAPSDLLLKAHHATATSRALDIALQLQSALQRTFKSISMASQQPSQPPFLTTTLVAQPRTRTKKPVPKDHNKHSKRCGSTSQVTIHPLKLKLGEPQRSTPSLHQDHTCSFKQFVRGLLLFDVSNDMYDHGQMYNNLK